MAKKKEILSEPTLLEPTENPNCFRYGEYMVEVEFSPDGPTLSEVIRQYMERKLDGLVDGETDNL